jgi:hypothetical protein
MRPPITDELRQVNNDLTQMSGPWKLGSRAHVEFWDAVNEFAFTGKNSVGRMNAVVKVEAAVIAAVEPMRKERDAALDELAAHKAEAERDGNVGNVANVGNTHLRKGEET